MYTNTSKFTYLAALDGWRAISILLVLVSHGGLGHIIPGGLGVTIFFFISGFLITSLLIAEFQSTHRISIKNFYLRRFWRLSPPLLVYIFLSTMFILYFANRLDYRELLASIFYFANYYSIYWHFDEFSFGPSPLKILWSLAIEEHYYLFFAPLMAFFFHTRERLLNLILFLVVVPLLVRLTVVFAGSGTLLNMGYTYMATEARIDSIAWGAGLAWLGNRHSAERLVRFFDNKIAISISVGLLLACLLIRDERFRESIRYTLQGIALVPLFYVTLHGQTLRHFTRMLTSKVLILIGKLSYSIYLYHWLALVIANWLVSTEKLSAQWLLPYYLITVCLSVASYKLIEKPSLVLRRKFGSHATA